MSKTYTEILASMKLNMESSRPDVETTEGTILSDVFEVIADEIEDVYVDIEHVGVLGSFRYWDKMSDDELEDLAYNYGIVRKPALAASGEVTFRTETLPTQDILITVGQVVTTEADERLKKKSYSVTAERTLVSANASSYYNDDTGYYELDVPVQCTETGDDSNAGVGSIKLIDGNIPRIDDVYNYSAFTNGSDKETNEDLADRCLLALQGVAIGTEAAYISKAMENIYVLDALLVGPGDSLMLRDNGLGGKIDLYIKVDRDNTDVYTQTTDTMTYSNETEKILTLQPVKEIVSVTGSVSGALVENVDWSFTADTGNYKGSIYDVSKVNFLTPLTFGETISIVYTYYSIVHTVQDEIETVRPITADAMVKLAVERKVDVTAYITENDTITDKDELIATVKTAVESFLDFKSLNGRIDQADVIYEIKKVSGVDNVQIPLDKLALAGQIGTSDLVFGENEYATAGTVTIT